MTSTKQMQDEPGGKPPLEEQAGKLLYESETLGWTGKAWDWGKADADMKDKYIRLAKERSRPYLPEDME